MNKVVTIELNEIDAKTFMQYRKYQDTFLKLLESGVFDQHNAAITLYFDSQGVIQMIDRKDTLYSARFDKPNLIFPQA